MRVQRLCVKLNLNISLYIRIQPSFFQTAIREIEKKIRKDEVSVRTTLKNSTAAAKHNHFVGLIGSNKWWARARRRRAPRQHSHWPQLGRDARAERTQRALALVAATARWRVGHIAQLLRAERRNERNIARCARRVVGVAHLRAPQRANRCVLFAQAVAFCLRLSLTPARTRRLHCGRPMFEHTFSM